MGEIIFAVKVRGALNQLSAQDLFVFDTPSFASYFLPLNIPTCAMSHGSEYAHWSDFSFIHLRSTMRRFLWKQLFINPVQKNLLLQKTGIPLFNSMHTMRRLSEDFKVPQASLEQFVTYLPVDVVAYSRNQQAREFIRKRYGIGNDEVVIACVSNFADYKRPELLPPIVVRVLGSISPSRVRFLFVGRKNVSSVSLEKFIESPESEKRCIRLLEVPPGEVRDIYSASDIALSTSVSETFGYFITEGMSAALPLVAYGDSGAVEELIENNVTGFLVKSENEFVDKLLLLISDKKMRDRMGAAGFSRVTKLFSIEAFKKRFVKILNNHLKLSIFLE